MGLMGWIFYFLIGIILFLIISFIDNKWSITKIQKLIISIIIMIFISGICFRYAINYTDNIFLVFVFLMIIDIIYNNYFLEKDFFDKNEKNIEYYILLIIVGFLINQEFINEVCEVFLTGDDLRIILWFLSFIFIYNFIKEKNILNFQDVHENHFMSEETVLVNYVKLKHRFRDIIKSEKDELQNILFAIMIYENSKKSNIIRQLDYLKFRLNGNKRKMGIMQVDSDKFISDSDSIKIVFKELEKMYSKKSSKNKAYEVIEKYNCDSLYVKYIFDIIKKF